jgi:glutaminyl-tRNA synthetase
MPTLCGLRRRGYTPESIRDFCDRIGIAKSNSVVDVALLEHCIREDLNERAPRVMVVLNPLRVVIDNYPEDNVEHFEIENHPFKPEYGSRKVPFSRVVYIERDDFREDPPKKFYRLSPGREVRLKGAYYITCTDVVRDEETGEVLELHCTYDPESRGGSTPDGRKVRGTLHWVSAPHALEAEVRRYDRLFAEVDPYDVEEGEDFTANLNPNSLTILSACKVEPGIADDPVGTRYQFFRQGYFCVDPDTTEELMIFNETVPLRDTWAKIAKAQKSRGR